MSLFRFCSLIQASPDEVDDVIPATITPRPTPPSSPSPSSPKHATFRLSGSSSSSSRKSSINTHAHTHTPVKTEVSFDRGVSSPHPTSPRRAPKLAKRSITHDETDTEADLRNKINEAFQEMVRVRCFYAIHLILQILVLSRQLVSLCLSPRLLA
jgi:hypothetical protein